MTDETPDELPVSAEPVEGSRVNITGTDHVTVEGTDPEATIEYYRDILGMPLVLSQPNLDRTELTHLFFDTGDGRLLSFFVTEERDVTDSHSPEPGGVHHLAFRLAADELQRAKRTLREEGYRVSEFDRGAFHSLYTRDPNGLTIELAADKYEIPDDRRGEVLARAHHERVADGAEFVQDVHMEAALDALDLPVERLTTPEAAAGADVED